MNVLDPCSKFHFDDINIKRDIYVQKVKVNFFFYHFSGLTLIIKLFVSLEASIPFHLIYSV